MCFRNAGAKKKCSTLGLLHKVQRGSGKAEEHARAKAASLFDKDM